MTSPILIAGIDPGGAGRHGWAVLDVGGMRPRYVGGGVGSELEVLCKIRAEQPKIVVIECPLALHLPQANVAVMSTCKSAGRLEAKIELMSLQVMSVSPEQWRASLIGRCKKGDNLDARVKRLLLALVRGWPARSTVHARDAAGAAIIGWRIWHVRERGEWAAALFGVRGEGTSEVPLPTKGNRP